MDEQNKKETQSGEKVSNEPDKSMVTQPEKPVNTPSYFNINAWRAMKEMANVFFQSRALPSHIQNAAQLMMIMQAGKELGMLPMESITNLYIVNGKVTLQGSGMLTKVLRAGIKVEWVSESETEAVVKLSGLGRPAYVSKFTMAEAQKAGLTGKDVWRKYPKNMLRWRALTNGARVFCPDVIQGMYMMEEIATNVDMGSDGEFIEVTKPAAVTPAPDDPNLAHTAPTQPIGYTSTSDQAKPATPAQIKFITSIMAEKNLTWEDDLRMPGTEGLSSREASALISRLQGMPKKIQPL
ncbi:MAG TPA: hypothetical protein VFX17_03705 [Patescibacteria group bacterium]|nr:hypothetical protein [Patescibacteria group bacterium]